MCGLLATTAPICPCEAWGEDAVREAALEQQILPEDEFRELTDEAPLTEEEERAQREETEREALLAGPTYEELHPEELKLFWDRGIRLERNDRRFRMKIGGRLQLDQAWIRGDSSIRRSGLDDETDYEVRRGWLDVTGVIRNNFIYKAQIDLSGNSSGDDDRNRYIRQLYVGWTRPRDAQRRARGLLEGALHHGREHKRARVTAHGATPSARVRPQLQPGRRVQQPGLRQAGQLVGRRVPTLGRRRGGEASQPDRACDGASLDTG